MTAYVLIVEDEDLFVGSIQRVLQDLSSATQFKIARSRDSAFALLESDFFDFVILDLKIPTTDGLLDTDPQHGFAVLSRAQAVASGTPIFVLTGSSAEGFISDLLRGARQVDVWGEGRNTGTVDFLEKYRFDLFPERLRPSVAAIDALDGVELDRNGVALSIREARLIRIFSRRYGGTRVVASMLGGGLSGAKVLRLRVTDSQGAMIYDAVAKLGTLSAVTDEGGRFDNLVARLEAKVTPRKLVTLEAGAGALAGVFYSLAAGFNETAFQAACGEGGHATAAVASVESGTRRWRDGVNESRRTVREVRQRLLSDEGLTRLLLHFDLAWTAEFEVRQIQTRWSCVHGDLHGENVLVAHDGSAVIIDYGDVGEGMVSLDPVTLELSLLFHPKGPLRPGNAGFGAWPTQAQAAAWGDLDQYVIGCPAEAFVRECRSWAVRSAAGHREIAATAYSYLVRQLKYGDTNKDLALALLTGVRAYYDRT
jgi:CheY-like chemotaxis protein